MECCCGKENEILIEKLNKKNIDVLKIAPIIEKYKEIDGSLITVLQKAQDVYSYLPIELLNYIAVSMDIPQAKVLGVATFYAQFRLEPVGKHLIMLCQGTACHVNGSSLIEEVIKEELSIRDGETTEDGLFTLQNVACLGCCSLSPVMMIGRDTYGMLTPSKVRDILKEIKTTTIAREQGES